MQLPPEVLGLAFAYLEKLTLLNVRLVCKSFEEVASPFVFDEVYVSYTRGDLKIAKLTALRFGRYIRTLVFTPTFTECNWDDFQASTLRRFRNRRIEPPPCFNLHLEHAWDRYIGQRVEWREVDERGELVEHLRFILGRISRLQKIRIIGCPIFKYIAGESVFACLEHVRTSHEAFFDMDPDRLDCTTTNGTRAWGSLMLALSSTKTCVKEIVADFWNGYQWISCRAFDMSQAQALDFADGFRCLTKILLNLTGWDYESQESTQDAGIQGSVAKALAGATNLEQLELVLEGDRVLQFESILGGCSFSKLKSLELSSVESTEDQLVGFLRSSAGLEQLRLDEHILTLGLWEHAAYRIKQILQLQTVQIHRICGGMPQGFEEEEVWDPLSDRSVNDFFLHNGENPFTKEALERTKVE